MTEHIIPHLPPPLQSSSSSSSSSPSIKNSSQWSDLPKRLGTILTLAPLVVAFLYQSPQSSMLFFTVIHYVCALEWMDLVPDYLRSIVQYNGNDDGMDGTTNDEDTSSSIISSPSSSPPLLAVILEPKRIFPILSILISILPSEVFPIGLLFVVSFFHLLPYVLAALYYSDDDDDEYKLNNNDNKNEIKNNDTQKDRQQQRQHPRQIKSQQKLRQRILSDHAIRGLAYLAPSFHIWMRLVVFVIHPLSSSPSSCTTTSNIDTTTTTNSNIDIWYGFTNASFVLLISWTCDTGALIVGRLSKSFLRHTTTKTTTTTTTLTHSSSSFFHRFLRNVSPAKSIAGTLGGPIFGMFVAYIFPSIVSIYGRTSTKNDTSVLPEPILLNDSRRILLGLLLSIAAIFGDLSESSIKRAAGVGKGSDKKEGRKDENNGNNKDNNIKDDNRNENANKKEVKKKDNSGDKGSGSKFVLPGHGGVLDRFDSTLTAAAVFLFAMYVYDNRLI